MRVRTGVLLTGLLAVGAALFWFETARTRRKAEAEFALLMSRRLELASEIDRLKNLPLPEAPKKSADALAVKSGMPEEATLAARLQGVKLRPWASGTIYGDMALVDTDRTLQLLELQRQRASISLYYGEFFENAGLSPAQIEQLIEAKLKLEELAMDLDAVGRARDTNGRQAMAAMERQAELEHEASLQKTLGPEGRRALAEFERTQPWRRAVVNSFASVAALSGTPLSAEQGNQLLQAALEAAPAELNPSDARIMPEIDLAVLDARARKILTPEQFEVFSRPHFWRATLEYNAVMQKVRKAEEAQHP